MSQSTALKTSGDLPFENGTAMSANTLHTSDMTYISEEAFES